MKNLYYDVVIAGCGVAGLYAASAGILRRENMKKTRLNRVLAFVLALMLLVQMPRRC